MTMPARDPQWNKQRLADLEKLIPEAEDQGRDRDAEQLRQERKQRLEIQEQDAAQQTPTSPKAAKPEK